MNIYSQPNKDFPDKNKREEFLRDEYGPLYIALLINLELNEAVHKAVNKIEDRIQKSLDKFAAKNFDILKKII